MGRKTLEYTLQGGPENRDAGKRYLITEWPADKAEDWGMRALIAVARSGADVPPEAMGGGMLGVAMMGLRSMAGINSAEVVGLLNELMECVQALPGKGGDDRVKRALIPDDTEEVTTRLKLKSEVFALHTGFPLAEIKEKLISALKRAGSSSTEGQGP
jgi:hypothetical protein